MREQLLAANHFLMGTTNLIVMEVPDEWMVMDGTTGPEVDRWTEVGATRWLSAGQAHYRLIRPHPGKTQLARTQVDLTVWAAPIGAEPPAAPTAPAFSGGELDLGEHAARFVNCTVKRGLLPRRDVPALHLSLTCAQTGRHLQLEFAVGFQNGRALASREDLLELMAGLKSGFRCH